MSLRVAQKCCVQLFHLLVQNVSQFQGLQYRQGADDEALVAAWRGAFHFYLHVRGDCVRSYVHLPQRSSNKLLRQLRCRVKAVHLRLDDERPHLGALNLVVQLRLVGLLSRTLLQLTGGFVKLFVKLPLLQKLVYCDDVVRQRGIDCPWIVRSYRVRVIKTVPQIGYRLLVRGMLGYHVWIKKVERDLVQALVTQRDRSLCSEFCCDEPGCLFVFLVLLRLLLHWGEIVVMKAILYNSHLVYLTIFYFKKLLNY